MSGAAVRADRAWSTRVLVVYCRADRRYVLELLRHLRVLQHSRGIHPCLVHLDDSGQAAPAGEIDADDTDKLTGALSDPRVIYAVVLVGVEFINALQATVPHLGGLLVEVRGRGAPVMPVLVGYCAWEHTPELARVMAYAAFNHRRSYAKDRPLAALRRPVRQRLWVDLAREIIKAHQGEMVDGS